MKDYNLVHVLGVTMKNIALSLLCTWLLLFLTLMVLSVFNIEPHNDITVALYAISCILFTVSFSVGSYKIGEFK